MEWLEVGTVVTAIGTLALAGATFYLGLQTARVVDAARDEAHAASRQVDVSQRQSDTARETLDAQTAPFLTSVPVTTPAELLLTMLSRRR